MAGGRGTRISSIANEIPKPMIKILDKPVLEHALEKLSSQGIKDFIITVGYLKEVIMEYFGDGSGFSPATGKPFGVNIEYFEEEKPLGNAGALFCIKNRLTDDFLLINGDVLFDVDICRFYSYHQEKRGLVTLFTHPNNHPYDSGIIVADSNGEVRKWLAKEDERPKYYKNRVNAGLHIISRKVLEQEINKDKIDLDRDLLKPLAGKGCMYAYDSSEYVKDMGTPERFVAVNKDCESGKVENRNLNKKQKAVFIDRDGTINKYVGFLKHKEEFELLPKVSEAIRKINCSEYLAIVVTNQPVIARGEVEIDELEEIHNKMETLLGEDGAFVDKIFFCPHHPDKGYEGERIEYKIECDCRKPKPGMILKAAEEFNIDLASSWMIGDSDNDISAGKAAGCKTALIGEKEEGQDVTVSCLYEFVELVLKD